MFSNLSKGSVLYGLDTKDGIKVFNATVDTVSIPRPRFMQNTFGQLPEMVLDIVANVNGERKEYKEIPVNNVIADFGPNTFVLSDSKDSLLNYLKAKLQESKNIVSNKSVRAKVCNGIVYRNLLVFLPLTIHISHYVQHHLWKLAKCVLHKSGSRY